MGVEQALDTAAQIGVSVTRLVQECGPRLGRVLLQGREKNRLDDVEGIHDLLPGMGSGR